MNGLSPRQRQNGYLLEIPILLMAEGVVISIVFPMLSPLGQKILIGIAAVALLFGLYYMIVVPGWMPGDSGRIRPPWNLLVFLLLTAAIIAGMVLFVIG